MLKLFIIILLQIPVLSAQEKAVDIENIQSDKESFEQIKTDRLKRIRKELVLIERNIFRLKKNIQDEEDMVLKLKLESELMTNQKSYLKKREFSSSKQLRTLVSMTKNLKLKKESLLDDLKEIFDPALQGIKKASEAP